MSSFLQQAELERETVVRRYVCPTCHAERNKPCQYQSRSTRRSLDVSHTSRYVKGLASGLVPALPGDGE